MRRAGQRRGAGNIGAGGGGGAGEPGPSAEGLRQAVEQLLLQLGRTLLRDGGDGSPRAGLADGSLSPRLLLRQLLALVYRLLFLLLAEGRQLLPGPWCDAGARQRYQELCSLHGLLGEVVAAAAGQRSPTTTSPGAWERLQVTSAGLCRGCPELGLPVLGSWLWSDEAVPWLGRVRPSEEELLAALAPLAALARLATPPRSSEGADGSEWARVEVEQLGRLHESLLELEPEVDPAAGDFHLRSTAHHQRRAAGSYYTPPELVGCLLDVALEPLLDERLAAAATPSAREQALLGLRLCDPACGAGSFLLAAGRRIARRLAGERATGPPGPSAEEQRAALGEVAERCLFGVDLDPLAVELVKVGLWLELGRPELPLSSFDGLLRRGNALLGATPSLLAGSGLSPGSSDDADRWCASFFFPPCPTPPAAATVSGAAAPVARLAREQGFLHWHLE
ncbi:MAG: hypothetical protein FJ125_17950, partial [Deltaproteobacteria bacterium]|nr:hypothetical protein [Deltaproteobacteria bacterium]